ncbi:hypothetical protein AMATHDRAFT_139639 [Amanita thiersii Skay4041]|uniref:HIT-type domain-containing protein n=1 Tax=Amanita thiersii Skay4041 TaxID=703135 RepID=A0A2A9NNS3_9AGAR|nr:hypothetical protein AMATHDRAFT_139639 [Amanita thiersii Skay4041]
MSRTDVKLSLSEAPTKSQQCAVCKISEAKYTCPRCSLHSCSVACSSSHKKTNNCPGARNKAEYIPMNKYGWGAMMDDYVFLEEMGRKVGDWGREIVRGKYDLRPGSSSQTKRKPMHVNVTRGKTKRDILKLQLEARDIEMDLLPVGMERRKVNQSCWDNKRKTAFLTIEMKFYQPADPLAPPSATREKPIRLLTHRNDINTSLLELIQKQVSSNKKLPSWVKSLVTADEDSPESFITPHVVMSALREAVPIVGLLSYQHQSAYYRFDPAEPLSSLLKGTCFVEFPTIEVYEEFNGVVIDAKGTLMYAVHEQPRVKRRRLNTQAGKAAMNMLVGDYGSDDEEVGENALSKLGEYTDGGSEGEKEAELETELSVNESDISDEEDMSDDEVKADPVALLELLREAQKKGQWMAQDEVDWGETSEGEPE